MNTVLGPMVRWGIFDRLIKHGLKGDERGAPITGDSSRGGAIGIKLGEPFVTDGAAAQHERLADDEFHFWEGFAGALEQGAIVALVDFHCSIVFAIEFMPDVIYSDKNAQDAGLEVEAVGLPVVGELEDFIAADAP